MGGYTDLARLSDQSLALGYDRITGAQDCTLGKSGRATGRRLSRQHPLTWGTPPIEVADDGDVPDHQDNGVNTVSRRSIPDAGGTSQLDSDGYG